MPGTDAWTARKCEGGCKRDWTVEWVRNPADDGEDIVTWRLCHEHAAISRATLEALGFQSFTTAEVPA